MALKLRQSQIWKLGKIYLRIVKLERLSVDYKEMPAPGSQSGTHHTLTKKEFCRLLKNATLVTPETHTEIETPQQTPQSRSLPSSLRSTRLPMASSFTSSTEPVQKTVRPSRPPARRKQQ